MNTHRNSIPDRVFFPVVIAFPLVVWTIDLLLYKGSLTLDGTEHPLQRIAGEMTATCVLTLLAVNLLMATRSRRIERFFGGLDRMFRIHRRSAIIATGLLLLHVAVSPRFPAPTPGKPLGVLALVLLFSGVLISAAPFFKQRLPYHNWLKKHRFMGLFFILAVGHALLVPTLFSKLPLVRAYVLDIALIGGASWIYRVFLLRRLRPPHRYEVTEVKRLRQNVLALEMAATGSPLQPLPGQFAFFSFPGVFSGEPHPFTIAGTPDRNRIRIAVKALGDFTGSLRERIETGDEVRVEGPYGLFAEGASRSRHRIWIAGGIGITPFLTMAAGLHDPEARVALYWTVNGKEEACFDKELQDIARRTPGLTYTLWLSEENGPLTPDAIPEAGSPGSFDIFLCGPESLRKSLTAGFLAAGVPRQNIRSEEFSLR